jgi:hypothetical protein
LLKRALTVDLLSDTVEQFRELDKVPVALDQPLLLLETTPLQFTNELDIRGKGRRTLSRLDHWETKSPKRLREKRPEGGAHLQCNLLCRRLFTYRGRALHTPSEWNIRAKLRIPGVLCYYFPSNLELSLLDGCI